ncbi:MAG: hypothetical protein ACREVV_03065 [Steroidobacteraceae bacterium]
MLRAIDLAVLALTEPAATEDGPRDSRPPDNFTAFWGCVFA